jgi:hypothetical protein
MQSIHHTRRLYQPCILPLRPRNHLSPLPPACPPAQGPCCHDGLSARLIEQAGFDFAFMSGFCTAAARLGAPDTGLISYGEMVDVGRCCHEATRRLPSALGRCRMLLLCHRPPPSWVQCGARCRRRSAAPWPACLLFTLVLLLAALPLPLPPRWLVPQLAPNAAGSKPACSLPVLPQSSATATPGTATR